MTPLTNTLYSVTLFLALVILKLWNDRRHRNPRACRKSILTTASEL